jgi:hypothetical protein
MPQSRRHFLMSLFALAALSLVPATAPADQGSGGGGSGNSGSGGSESGDSGGNGGGGDNDGNDDSGGNKGKDDEKDDDNVGHDDARDAVESGEAMSLRKAMRRAKDQTNGRIIDVSLARKGSRFIYVFTVVQPSGRIETLKMDALSGKFAGLLGF